MDLLLVLGLFLVGMVFCLVTGHTILWAMLWSLLLFFALGRHRGFSSATLAGMAGSKIKTALIVLRIFVYIGLLTALWRSGGVIAYVIYHGIRLVSPPWFLLLTYLLMALMAFALGTSFGVSSTVGVILITLARVGGVNEVLTAGAIISGAYFGDRGSPASSCANLVAAVTETELYSNVRRMMQTAILPLVLTIGFYAVLSPRNPITAVDDAMLNALEESFVLSPWAIVPIVLMLGLPLLKVPVRLAMLSSAMVAFVLTVTLQQVSLVDALRYAVLGYTMREGLLAEILSGGGLVSMVTAAAIIFATSLTSGILEGTGMLSSTQELLLRWSERRGRFLVMAMVCLLLTMVLCNQTIVIMMAVPLMKTIYDRKGCSRTELAMDLANSGVLLAAVVPWSIAVSMPLTMLEVSPEAILYAVYLWLVPVCYGLTRHRFFPKLQHKEGMKHD